MKSSGNSSAKANLGPRFSVTPLSSTSQRKSFALTGRSVRLDPRTHAVRGDLADVRLAEQVFAPHYAEPVACAVTRDVSLTAAPDGEIVARLVAGDVFELLELAGRHGWGIAPGAGLVGYCDRTALGLA